ncbi:MAG TPA: hypothetical protein VFE01_05145 [Terracidiphilus sp.]|nr:hypothetical protein [Terracidiphilus sp.]
MPEFDWQWIETQVEQTAAVWRGCAGLPLPPAPHFDRLSHQVREKASDEAQRAVERELKRAPRGKGERLALQERVTAQFARFAGTALDLEPAAVRLIADDFLPAGTGLARWARQFDPTLTRSDITQACRNAWTACGLQLLLGERAVLTPSILGYSLLYPYTDNFLDRRDISATAKIQFSIRLRDRLCGHALASNQQEAAPWALVELIEGEYPRAHYPQIFECLLAIHRAQEESLAQLRNDTLNDAEILRISCAKGGASVLADACFARGRLNKRESRFAFAWGVLLQLGDDLQDVRDDLECGSVTVFTRAIALGLPLDGLVTQLLNFSEEAGAAMDALPSGTETLKSLMRMSWRSLIIGAVAHASDFFSPEFLREAESRSPFRFDFIRARQKRLTARRGLYEVLFDAFLEAHLETQPGRRESMQEPATVRLSF